ncbi:hypothetical protein [Glaciimonas sp. PCH181]|uniref:hypothetical protein n=1 Tax=Glaciimonas sp. PCH181 TaxID=2133943 RepID=UPI00191C377A|nr:hypothetical protein [Glaciimonas sp. PCH181]
MFPRNTVDGNVRLKAKAGSASSASVSAINQRLVHFVACIETPLLCYVMSSSAGPVDARNGRLRNIAFCDGDLKEIVFALNAAKNEESQLKNSALDHGQIPE